MPRVIIGEFLAEGDDVFLAGITVNQNVLRHDGDNGVGAGSRPIGINDADVIVAGLDDFELFWDNKPVNGLYKFGLLNP